MSASIQGDSVVWGVPHRVSGMFITDVEYKKDGDAAKEIKDEDGITQTVVNNNPFETLKVNGIPTGNSPITLPAKGSLVSVILASVTSSWMVMDAGNQWNQENEQKISLDLKKWPSVTLS